MPKHLQVGGTPSDGQVPTYNGSGAAWATPSSGGGAAVTCANLTSGATSGSLSSATTASITPTANELALATVSIRNGASTQPTTPTLTGCGLTWVLVDHADLDTTSGSRRTVFLFRAMGSSPTPGAVTITPGETETDIVWVIDQLANVSTAGSNGSGAIVQHVPGSDQTIGITSLSITLSAFSSPGNATYAAFGTDGATGPVAGSGFTLIGHGNSGTTETADTEFKASNDTTVDMSWGVTAGLGGIAVEVAAVGPVTSVAGRTGNVVLTADDMTDGTTNKAYTATEKTKLAGIATGADVTATQLPVATHAATSKPTPVDADELPIVDSAASNGLKKLTWANLKATLKTYLDTLYAAIVHTHAESDITGLITDLSNKQPLDSDLTTIAGLTPTTDNFIVSVSSAWASRTPAQVRTTLGLVIGTDVEAHDTDLTTIAGLTPTNDDIIQRKAGAWTNRTMAQLKTDLVLVKGDVGLGNVDNTSDATKNSATATLTNKRITTRVTTITSSATPTINTDNCSAVSITALAAAISSMTTNLTGTPNDFDKLVFRIKDDGTARAITWGTSFEAKGVALPTTTVISKVLTVVFLWDAVTSKWGCVASAQEA